MFYKILFYISCFRECKYYWGIIMSHWYHKNYLDSKVNWRTLSQVGKIRVYCTIVVICVGSLERGSPKDLTPIRHEFNLHIRDWHHSSPKTLRWWIYGSSSLYGTQLSHFYSMWNLDSHLDSQHLAHHWKYCHSFNNKNI